MATNTSQSSRKHKQQWRPLNKTHFGCSWHRAQQPSPPEARARDRESQQVWKCHRSEAFECWGMQKWVLKWLIQALGYWGPQVRIDEGIPFYRSSFHSGQCCWDPSITSSRMTFSDSFWLYQSRKGVPVQLHVYDWGRDQVDIIMEVKWSGANNLFSEHIFNQNKMPQDQMSLKTCSSYRHPTLLRGMDLHLLTDQLEKKLFSSMYYIFDIGGNPGCCH